MSSAEGPAQAPYPKLPFSRTVRLAYSSYFQNLAGLLRAAWPALLLVAAARSLTRWQQGPEAFGDVTRPPSFWAVSVPLKALLLTDAVLIIVVAASIAVAWHRLIILREPLRVIGSNTTTINFWRYVVAGAALAPVLLVPVTLDHLPLGDILPAPLIARMNIHSEVTLLLLLLGSFVAYGVPAVIIARLCLLLPVRAIARDGWPIREAWKRTKGNVWRLLWGAVFTTVPLLVIMKPMIDWLIDRAILIKGSGTDLEEDLATDAMLAMTGSDVLMVLFNLLILPISIGFLSLAYRHFFERPLEQTAPDT